MSIMTSETAADEVPLLECKLEPEIETAASEQANTELFEEATAASPKAELLPAADTTAETTIVPITVATRSIEEVAETTTATSTIAKSEPLTTTNAFDTAVTYTTTTIDSTAPAPEIMTIIQEQPIKVEMMETLETKYHIEDIRDNGIFDFMTPERAIELYTRIHSNGVPGLEWKFYGRRQAVEPQENDKNDNQCDNTAEKNLDQQQSDDMHESLVQTEFDFDESFAELSTDTSTIINDSLQLKNRPEPGSEKKTNLSDIMSHLMKEKSLTEE